VKKTDYTKVALRYDENQDRHRIQPDPTLAALLEREPARRRAVLDLACGTGNWLAVQTKAYAGRSVAWFGLDASEAMLERARPKLTNVELGLGSAERLPYPDRSIDYLIVSFAFHHFEDKPRVLDEMARVLTDDGTLAIVNVAPTHMRRWWVYSRFWRAYPEDETRFWSPERLFLEVDKHGFEPVARVEYELYHLELVRIAEDIERRDISQLAILPDDDHQRGLERVRADLEANPGAREQTEIALLRFTAQRR